MKLMPRIRLILELGKFNIKESLWNSLDTSYSFRWSWGKVLLAALLILLAHHKYILNRFKHLTIIIILPGWWKLFRVHYWVWWVIGLITAITVSSILGKLWQIMTAFTLFLIWVPIATTILRILQLDSKTPLAVYRPQMLELLMHYNIIINYNGVAARDNSLLKL